MAYQRWWKTIRDQQGNAVNGASCTVYEVGTPTIATVYDPNSDDATPSPQANPFTTTSNGRFGFMAADGEYDVQISGGNGATQQYRVTLNGFVSGSAASLSVDLAAPTGAGLVGFDDSLTYPAGTVGEDLVLPRPVARGGTGGDTVASALSNLGIIDMATEIPISTSVAMDNSYINKSVVCGSAGAFYSPVLPPSAPIGSSIMVRIDRAMAFLVVLTAGGSDTIDGTTTRRMWAGESAILLKTAATTWTKIAGLTIPFAGTIIRTSNQLVATGGTFVAVDFVTADSPGSGFCWDSTNNRFRAARDGRWSLKANIPISITNNTSIGTADFGFGKNAAVNTTAPNCFDSYPLPVIATSQRIVGKPSGVFNLVAGDYVEAIVRAASTAANFNVESVTPTIDPCLSYNEIPTW